MTNWCILRTAPSRTLLLAAALTEAGYTAWTPEEAIVRRAPRGGTKKVTVALTPTIVFADYERLPEFVAISRLPPSLSHGLPPFSVFRYLDGYPRIADRALDALRLAEQRGRPRKQVRAFHRDDLVKCPGGGFEGLVGRVEGTKGKFTIVVFPSANFPVEIMAQDLLPASAAA
jgi:hypothetical protein